VRALVRRAHDTLAMDQHDDLPLLAGLAPHAEVVWDYRRSQHSTRGHPLQHLRPQLQRLGLPTAAEVAAMRDGRSVRYVGLVICRQRPGTAKGVTFFTLEDETGFVNLVLWREIYERFRLLAKTAVVTGVDGRVQARDGVTHVVVEALWEPELAAAVPAVPSRDFH
jgi:error-prone DNA polymerase